MTPRKPLTAEQEARLQAMQDEIKEVLTSLGASDWSLTDFMTSFTFLLTDWQELAQWLDEQGIPTHDETSKYIPQRRQVELLIAQIREEERHQAAMEARYGSHQRDEDAAALPPD